MERRMPDPDYAPQAFTRAIFPTLVGCPAPLADDKKKGGMTTITEAEARCKGWCGGAYYTPVDLGEGYAPAVSLHGLFLLENLEEIVGANRKENKKVDCWMIDNWYYKEATYRAWCCSPEGRIVHGMFFTLGILCLVAVLVFG